MSGGGNLDETEGEKAEVAGYIADMLSELQPMAQRARLHFLAYLIRLASEQAEAERESSGRWRRGRRQA